MTEPLPVVKSATVAFGLASVKVAMTTLPVLIPSSPVIEVPEAVIGASTTVAVPGVKAVATPPLVVTVIATVYEPSSV